MDKLFEVGMREWSAVTLKGQAKGFIRIDHLAAELV